MTVVERRVLMCQLALEQERNPELFKRMGVSVKTMEYGTKRKDGDRTGKIEG